MFLVRINVSLPCGSSLKTSVCDVPDYYEYVMGIIGRCNGSQP
jgi:hypothetical protein